MGVMSRAVARLITLFFIGLLWVAVLCQESVYLGTYLRQCFFGSGLSRPDALHARPDDGAVQLAPLGEVAEAPHLGVLTLGEEGLAISRRLILPEEVVGASGRLQGREDLPGYRQNIQSERYL